MAAQTLYFRSVTSTKVTNCAQLSTTAGTTLNSATSYKYAKNTTGTTNEYAIEPNIAFTGTPTAIALGSEAGLGWVFDGSTPGTYAAGTWTATIDCKFASASGTVNFVVNIWKSAAGSGPAVTNGSGVTGSKSASFTPSTTQGTKTVSITMPSYTVNSGEYLYVEIALQATAASSSTTQTVTFYQDDPSTTLQGKIVTTSFTAGPVTVTNTATTAISAKFGAKGIFTESVTSALTATATQVLKASTRVTASVTTALSARFTPLANLSAKATSAQSAAWKATGNTKISATSPLTAKVSGFVRMSLSATVAEIAKISARTSLSKSASTTISSLMSLSAKSVASKATLLTAVWTGSGRINTKATTGLSAILRAKTTTVSAAASILSGKLTARTSSSESGAVTITPKVTMIGSIKASATSTASGKFTALGRASGAATVSLLAKAQLLAKAIYSAPSVLSAKIQAITKPLLKVTSPINAQYQAFITIKESAITSLYGRFYATGKAIATAQTVVVAKSRMVVNAALEAITSLTAQASVRASSGLQTITLYATTTITPHFAGFVNTTFRSNVLTAAKWFASGQVTQRATSPLSGRFIAQGQAKVTGIVLESAHLALLTKPTALVAATPVSPRFTTTTKASTSQVIPMAGAFLKSVTIRFVQTVSMNVRFSASAYIHQSASAGMRALAAVYNPYAQVIKRGALWLQNKTWMRHVGYLVADLLKVQFVPILDWSEAQRQANTAPFDHESYLLEIDDQNVVSVTAAEVMNKGTRIK